MGVGTLHRQDAQTNDGGEGGGEDGGGLDDEGHDSPHQDSDVARQPRHVGNVGVKGFVDDGGDAPFQHGAEEFDDADEGTGEHHERNDEKNDAHVHISHAAVVEEVVAGFGNSYSHPGHNVVVQGALFAEVRPYSCGYVGHHRKDFGHGRRCHGGRGRGQHGGRGQRHGGRGVEVIGLAEALQDGVEVVPVALRPAVHNLLVQLDDEVGEGVRDDSEDFDGAALGVDEGFHHRSCQVFQHVSYDLNSQQYDDSEPIEHVVNSATGKSSSEDGAVTHLRQRHEGVGHRSAHVGAHDDGNGVVHGQHARGHHGDDDGSGGGGGLHQHCEEDANDQPHDGVLDVRVVGQRGGILAGDEFEGV